MDMRTVFAAFVLAGLAATSAFSQSLFPPRDRDRPELWPAINSERSDQTVTRVPLPRARPNMFAAIPLPRPVPTGATRAADLIPPDPAPVAPEPAPVAPEMA